MKATIYGFNSYDNKKFSYTLDNVISIQYVIDTIIIAYIREEKVQSTSYHKDSVKIIIEN